MTESERIEALARAMCEGVQSCFPTERAFRWHDANEMTRAIYEASARAALAWLGFKKCPREGAVREAIGWLRTQVDLAADGTGIEVTWEDWQEAVRRALAALEGE